MSTLSLGSCPRLPPCLRPSPFGVIAQGPGVQWCPRPSARELVAPGSVLVLPGCTLGEPAFSGLAPAHVSGLSPIFLSWVRGEAFPLTGSTLWHFPRVLELRHCPQSLSKGEGNGGKGERQDLRGRREGWKSQLLSGLPQPVAFPSRRVRWWMAIEIGVTHPRGPPFLCWPRGPGSPSWVWPPWSGCHPTAIHFPRGMGLRQEAGFLVISSF